MEYTNSRLSQASTIGSLPMLTIHVRQSGPSYVIDTLNFSDEEALIVYLRAQGVSHENIMKALESLVREGAYTIEQEEKTLAVEEEYAMAPQTPLQVLVVDDNPGILSALTRLLQRDGHTVQTAADGQAALALLNERSYDLILCDLLMPELDGQTLYGLLQRQLPALCQRMIFLTGDTLSPESMLFVEQCGLPWIPKPCGIAEVRTAMAQVLPAPVQDAPAEHG
jgi:CheY-like chemotaxis protein